MTDSEKIFKQDYYYQKLLNYIDHLIHSFVIVHGKLNNEKLTILYYSISSITVFSLNTNLINNKQCNYIISKVIELI